MSAESFNSVVSGLAVEGDEDSSAPFLSSGSSCATSSVLGGEEEASTAVSALGCSGAAGSGSDGTASTSEAFSEASGSTLSSEIASQTR